MGAGTDPPERESAVEGAPARPGVPPFLKRRMIVLIASSVGVGLLAPVATLLLNNGTVPRWAFIAAVAIPGVASGLIGACMGLAVHIEQKRARLADGRRCWWCGYELEGLSDAGTCPECGRAFTIADLRARWGVIHTQG